MENTKNWEAIEAEEKNVVSDIWADNADVEDSAWNATAASTWNATAASTWNATAASTWNATAVSVWNATQERL